jgi:hypothetical protein
MGDRHIPTFSPNPEFIEGSREKEIYPLAPWPGFKGYIGVFPYESFWGDGAG